MTLKDILATLKAIKSDVATGNWVDAAKKALPLLAYALDMMGGTGARAVTEADSEYVKEIKLELAMLDHQLDSHASLAIGDGKIRDFLKWLIPILLPILIG